MSAADKKVPTVQKLRRGFAVMDPQRQREIAAMGGTAAHREGRAHQYTSEEAKAANRRRHGLPDLPEKKRGA